MSLTRKRGKLTKVAAESWWCEAWERWKLTTCLLVERTFERRGAAFGHCDWGEGEIVDGGRRADCNGEGALELWQVRIGSRARRM